MKTFKLITEYLEEIVSLLKENNKLLKELKKNGMDKQAPKKGEAKE